jgi:hypothetical protein
MSDRWPDISYPAWMDTCAALHQWLQIAGKYRLALTPWVNHSWHATFHVGARGLGAPPIHAPRASVQISFDLLAHELVIATSSGGTERIALEAMPVARFHDRFCEALKRLGVFVPFHGVPNEIPDPVPFAENDAPGAYDAQAVERFFQALLRIDRVLRLFRTGFIGKVSPVHLFWGSFDMAVTRFSGRRAPEHPGGIPALPDDITREAYSHEVSSAGFWPGGGPVDFPAFYSYAYPAPSGFAQATVAPAAASYDAALGEFLLPYDAVRTADDPDATLLAFLQSTYAAAADLAGWDRSALECPLGDAGVVRELP